MILAFWLLISLTLYCYFGYPLLLWLMARLRPNPVQKGSFEPKISVVLSVWNEEDVIKEKLQNLLSLDYPKEKRRSSSARTVPPTKRPGSSAASTTLGSI